MRTILFLLTSVAAFGQCPTAIPVDTTTCKSSPEGFYEAPVTITPAYSDTSQATTYKWTVAPPAIISGNTTGPTLKVNTAGVFSLTIKQGSCESVTSHTVSNCPPGTDMVGIEEYGLSHERKYFDLYGNPTEVKSGVILIEQIGTRRKKVIFE